MEIRTVYLFQRLLLKASCTRAHVLKRNAPPKKPPAQQSLRIGNPQLSRNLFLHNYLQSMLGGNITWCSLQIVALDLLCEDRNKWPAYIKYFKAFPSKLCVFSIVQSRIFPPSTSISPTNPPFWRHYYTCGGTKDASSGFGLWAKTLRGQLSVPV